MAVSDPTLIRGLDVKAQATTKPHRGFLLERTGFAHISTLTLFVLTAGVFALFSAFQLQALDRYGKWDAPFTTGEKFWFLDGVRHVSNQVHLWSVIRKKLSMRFTCQMLISPAAGVFLPLQFLPGMRRRFTALHRIAGRVLFILLGIGSVSEYEFSALRCNF